MVQNIHEVKEPKQDVEPVEEKPWRKSGKLLLVSVHNL